MLKNNKSTIELFQWKANDDGDNTCRRANNIQKDMSKTKYKRKTIHQLQLNFNYFQNFMSYKIVWRIFTLLTYSISFLKYFTLFHIFLLLKSLKNLYTLYCHFNLIIFEILPNHIIYTP